MSALARTARLLMKTPSCPVLPGGSGGNAGRKRDCMEQKWEGAFLSNMSPVGKIVVSPFPPDLESAEKIRTQALFPVRSFASSLL